MVEQKTVLIIAIVTVSILVGAFFSTVKSTDRLTSREATIIGFFRNLTLWSAIGAYLFSLLSFLLALGLRASIISNDELFAMLGQPIASHLQAWGMLYLAMMSFIAASGAMIVYLIIAIEMHLRRIANNSDRSGYFNP